MMSRGGRGLGVESLELRIHPSPAFTWWREKEVLREMPRDTGFPDGKGKEKSSAHPRKVLPWMSSLAQAPEGPGRLGKFYLTKVFRFWFHFFMKGKYFFMFNDQFLKTEMSLVLQ